MAAALPLIVPLVLAGASFAQQESQAKQERGQAEIAAKQQELQVIQREGDRKDRLATALASQSARTSASGISAFEGSPLTVLEDSLERERVATERDVFSSDLSTLATRFTGRARQQAQRTRAGLGLLQTAATASQIGAPRG